MRSFSEENYLKAVYHLSGQQQEPVATNALAEKMQTKASSVTDMVKRLSDKELLSYTKYQGVTLTSKGLKAALDIVRKHRLWEVFLVDKLNFKWDEVHDVAEELEHIHSEELIERLDEFLQFPKTDPHGDPIPDKFGKFSESKMMLINKLKIGEKAIVTGVSEHSSPFLKHLEKLGLTLGVEIELLDYTEFDGSMELRKGVKNINISREIAKHILVSK